MEDQAVLETTEQKAKYNEADRRRFRAFARRQATKVEGEWTKDGDDYIVTAPDGSQTTISYATWLEQQNATPATEVEEATAEDSE